MCEMIYDQNKLLEHESIPKYPKYERIPHVCYPDLPVREEKETLPLHEKGDEDCSMSVYLHVLMAGVLYIATIFGVSYLMGMTDL